MTLSGYLVMQSTEFYTVVFAFDQMSGTKCRVTVIDRIAPLVWYGKNTHKPGHSFKLGDGMERASLLCFPFHPFSSNSVVHMEKNVSKNFFFDNPRHRTT